MMKAFYRAHRLVCGLFAMLFAVVSLLTLKAQEPIRVDTNPALVGYVKMAPIKALTADVMEVLRQLQTGPQVEMAAYYFLGQYGYPHFVGVSDSNDMVIMFFEDDAGHPGPFVVCAKIDKSSRIPGALSEAGWFVDRHGDWILTAPEEAFLRAVKDIEAVKQLSALPRETDVEGVLPGDALARHKDNLKMLTLLGSGAPLGGPDSGQVHGAMDALDIFITRASAFKTLSIGLDIDPGQFAIALAGEARPHTPEAILLSQKAGGQVDEARFIPVNKPMYWVSKFDPAAMQVYYDFLADEYKATLDDAQALQLDSIMSGMREMTSRMHGGGAGATTMSDATLDMVQIASGDMDDETLLLMLQNQLDSSKQVTEALLNSFGKLAHFDISQEITLEENFLEFEGIPVHRLRSEVEHTVLTAKGGEGREEQFQSMETIFFGADASDYEPGHSVTTRRSNYYAAVGGYYLSGTQEAGIKALIQTVLEGESASPSVSDFLELPEGRMLAMHLNLIDLVTRSIPEQLSPEAKKALGELSESGVEPMSMHWDIGEGKFFARLNIPVPTLAQLSQTMNRVMIEQSREHKTAPASLPETEPSSADGHTRAREE